MYPCCGIPSPGSLTGRAGTGRLVNRRNQGFIDGNEGTAYVTTRLFLKINGWDFQAPAVDCDLVFERLGGGEILADDLADRLRRHAARPDDSRPY